MRATSVGATLQWEYKVPGRTRLAGGDTEVWLLGDEGGVARQEEATRLAGGATGSSSDEVQ